MPSHADVPAALRKPRDAGFRLFTLTDNLLEVQTRQLEHGGIIDLFERRFSADGVKHHKPSRQVPNTAGIGLEVAGIETDARGYSLGRAIRPISDFNKEARRC
jgi:phosphoglycolate phosphatase-like HAD superfamily hydrolase